ncbi:MAG TPA: NAD+ synthase [Bdellovibrionales bacterium]|nr:NAD+ synthase [Bdellovibrionales bacterium]
MRVGLSQINATLGDFSGNREKIVQYIERAKAKHCDLVVFPELSLMGYLPNDLLERESIVDAQLKEFDKLVKQMPDGVAAIVGLITKTGKKKGKPYFNSAALIQKGKKPRFFNKELLPTYDVFDEARHIEKGSIAKGFFTFKGHRILMTICEDIWGWEIPEHATNYLENPLVALKKEKVDLVVNISASPFTRAKAKDRRSVVELTAKNFKAPMVYVNMVGGQDEVIFDGGSFAVDAKGKTLAQSIYFDEDLNIVDLKSREGGLREKPDTEIEAIRRALVLGIRDYVKKTGFSKVHLGFSGGIDSAVVAALAVDALGPNKVVGITLPGPFNEERSKTLSEDLAKNLGVRVHNVQIESSYQEVLRSYQSTFGEFDFGLVHENLQSRLRGVILMAYSNKENSMVLTTGNKCEYATGYATLYGDMCGGLAPIADLLKGEVYALARHYNSERELIPNEIIERAPSAELRPGQKDQDSLPPYEDLDASVRRLVEKMKPARTETDRWLLPILMRTEFKRWQGAPILKISGHAFGRGRRMPVAHRALY